MTGASLAHNTVVANLIAVNDAVPKTITNTFGTFEEGQIQADLRCMENSLAQPEVEIGDCKELGQTVVLIGALAGTYAFAWAKSKLPD